MNHASSFTGGSVSIGQRRTIVNSSKQSWQRFLCTFEIARRRHLFKQLVCTYAALPLHRHGLINGSLLVSCGIRQNLHIDSSATGIFINLYKLVNVRLNTSVFQYIECTFL